MSQTDDELDNLLMAYDLDNVDTNAKLTNKVLSGDEAIRRYGELQTNFLADVKQLIGKELVKELERLPQRYAAGHPALTYLVERTEQIKQEYGLAPEAGDE